VYDVIRTSLEVRRKAQDNPDWMVQEAKKRFPQLDPDLVDQMTRTYIKGKIWPVNGNVNREAAQFNIDFYSALTNIPPEKRTPETFYIFEPIEKVLADTGSDFVGDTPENFGKFVQAEHARWGKVVKQSGATVD